MINKIILASMLMIVAVAFTVSPVMAHVHPTVPADECALGSGAGNTATRANGANGSPPIPGLVLENTPSVVDGTADGPGVGPATDNCANA